MPNVEGLMKQGGLAQLHNSMYLRVFVASQADLKVNGIRTCPKVHVLAKYVLAKCKGREKYATSHRSFYKTADQKKFSTWLKEKGIKGFRVRLTDAPHIFRHRWIVGWEEELLTKKKKNVCKKKKKNEARKTLISSIRFSGHKCDCSTTMNWTLYRYVDATRG